MRFPVFARRSNASIDRPIMRKSMSYLETQIAEGLADWVDVAEPRRGIIARGMLYFGAREFQTFDSRMEKMPPVEVPGVRFIPPSNWVAWPLPVYSPHV